MNPAPTRSNIPSALACLLYGLFVVFLLVSSLWQGLSYFYTDRAFRSGEESDVAAAIRYGPENPSAYKTEGLVRLRTRDYAAAAASFEKAISFRENDYLLWSQLGFARQRMQDTAGALDAFERSIRLAPHYSQPQYHIGMQLLEAGRETEAFEYLSRAAQFDPQLDAVVQRLARRTFGGDPEAIEAAVRPATVGAKKSLARYLIKYHYMTDSIRSFLLGDGITPDEKNESIRYLLHKEDFQLAREVWFSRLKPDSPDPSITVYDGGFERLTGSDPSGLGWQIDQTISHTAVLSDRVDVHSGTGSLNVKFAGDVELRRPIVSQLVFVEPGRRYNLAFFVHAGELVSAGLPAVLVTSADSKVLLAESEIAVDSGGKWIQRTVDFTAPDSGVVLLSVQRPSCDASPCPIFGNLSIDDISVSKAAK